MREHESSPAVAQDTASRADMIAANG